MTEEEHRCQLRVYYEVREDLSSLPPTSRKWPTPDDTISAKSNGAPQQHTSVSLPLLSCLGLGIFSFQERGLGTADSYTRTDGHGGNAGRLPPNHGLLGRI